MYIYYFEKKINKKTNLREGQIRRKSSHRKKRSQEMGWKFNNPAALNVTVAGQQLITVTLLDVVGRGRLL